MRPFRPLSRQDKPDSRFDDLQEGLPAYLTTPVLDWFARFVWSYPPMGGVSVHADFLRTVQVMLRLDPPLRWSDDEDAARELRGRMERDPELALDAVDVALRRLGRGYDTEAIVSELNTLLETGGSVWEAVQDEDEEWRLSRRAMGMVRATIETLDDRAERSRHHLTSALSKIAGRDSDPSGAYREAVKGIESAAKPVVIPDAALATLGTIISAIRAKPEKWTYPLGGPEAMLDMLDRVWRGQHDRHGTDDPNAPLNMGFNEALAAVQLAVALAASCTSGVFARREADQDPGKDGEVQAT